MTAKAKNTTPKPKAPPKVQAPKEVPTAPPPVENKSEEAPKQEPERPKTNDIFGIL